MNRALVVMAVGAFVTLMLGVPDTRQPLLVVGLAALFTLLATLGYSWLQPRAEHRRLLAGAYMTVQLTLGVVLFGLTYASFGATLMLIVLVSQGVLILPLWAAVAVAAMGPLLHLGMAWRDALREGFGTLAAFAFAVVVTELLRRERRARAELAAANDQLRGYAEQAEQLATTQERNRLARDIHDGLGHHLTVVQMQVQAARAVLPTDPARADGVLAKAQQQASEALAEVRSSVAALREPRLQSPLPDRLAELATQTSAAGLPTELVVSGTPRALRAEVAESLYRVAQEGLTNVRKHARAQRAQLALDYGPADQVALQVVDDGTGIGTDAPGAESAGTDPADLGYGLVGLRERAAEVGGSLVLESSPGRGLTLRVEVPG